MVKIRNIGIGIVGVIVVITVLVFTGNLSIPQQVQQGELNIVLAPPLSFTPITQPTAVDIIIIGDINCRIKTTTLVYGSDGKLLEELQSGGISGSPFRILAFVTGTGVEIAGYNILPKVFCSQATGIPIEVFVKEMTMTARCEQPDTRLPCSQDNNIQNGKIVWQQGVTGSSLLKFGSGQGEQTLLNFYVPMNQVEESFPNQDFTMWMNFELTGTLAVQYSGFTFEYQIPIYRADIETHDEIEIRKAPTPTPVRDSDGDKVLDEFDLCPNDPETWNGFKDGDGCPDVPECPSGQIVITDPITGDFLRCEPTDEPPPICTSEICSQQVCLSAGGAWFESGFDLNGNPTAPYCDTSGEPTMCPMGERLVLGTGNVFSCQPEIAGCDEGFFEVTSRIISGECIANTGDVDGDGVINVNDQCLFEFGTVANNGCPSGVVPSNLEDEVLKGDIVTLTTVRFSDNSIQTATASAKQGGIQLPNLSQQISELVPLGLFGTITEGEGKLIDEIEIELFYFNNESPSGSVILEATSLDVILTIIESEVSSAMSNPIPIFGTIGSGTLIPQSGDVGLFGTGISLGKVTFRATNIIDLGEEAEITTGQRKDADLIFSLGGIVGFRDDSTRALFTLSNTLITFKNVDIDNMFIPKGLKCLDTQIEIIDPVSGKVIGCETPPPTTPKCFSSERPQGYACSPQDVITFCDGDPSSCREKDLDNDGVPDHRDECRDASLPDLLEDGLTINGSDPDDGCSALKRSIGCNPLIQNCTPEPPDNGEEPFCSVENPEKCIIPPEQLPTVLIISAIALVIIGVIIFTVRRRRSQIFGV